MTGCCASPGYQTETAEVTSGALPRARDESSICLVSDRVHLPALDQLLWCFVLGRCPKAGGARTDEDLAVGHEPSLRRSSGD